MSEPTTEPRTKTGRALLELWATKPAKTLNSVPDAVAAIEAEAARLALESVAEWVRALPPRSFVMEGPDADDREWMVTKAAVLAMLSSTPASEGDGS